MGHVDRFSGGNGTVECYGGLIRGYWYTLVKKGFEAWELPPGIIGIIGINLSVHSFCRVVHIRR